MVHPSFNATQPRYHGSVTRSLILSPVSVHSLALAGIIGGVALEIWVLWFIRTHKLKSNVTLDESSLLLRADLQRDHASTLDNEGLLCSICANIDFYKIFLNGIPETEDIPLDHLSSILRKSYQCNFCRLISFHDRRTWMLDKFPHVDISGIERRMFTKHCGCLQLASYPPSKFRC
ncbi:uncharacterized protein F5891DRAFT_30588 [Suillus fuscotomentosus]|uniref:Uncharacterized protein n=1 Tax=Suillus fuscotomentosus TaxID=1912939 RepID=A0AAD4HSU6_9AGAM|nr:uncharacterized protein F5891DRAFT_30588 [Suillus fuscotomentosus]KAG1908865.1 hypothetical protein F5891DRAFT_30588 [Suillus fuscotomentosus]